MTGTKTVFSKIWIQAVGVTFDNRQGKLWNLKKLYDAGNRLTIMLRREPTNERDINAIAVLAQCGPTTSKIGYIPADVAIWMAPIMDSHPKQVRAYTPNFIGGTKLKKTIGMRFEVCYPRDIPVYVPDTDSDKT